MVVYKPIRQVLWGGATECLYPVHYVQDTQYPNFSAYTNKDMAVGYPVDCKFPQAFKSMRVYE